MAMPMPPLNLSGKSSATSSSGDGNNIYFGNDGSNLTQDAIKYGALIVVAIIAFKLIKKGK